MKKQDVFQEALDQTDRKIVKLRKQFDEVQSLYTTGKIEEAYDMAIELEETSEKTVLLARVLPVYTGNPRAKPEVENAMRLSIPIEIGFTVEGWFSIKNQAFYHCSKLTGDIVLPSTLKEVCTYAFGDCTSLKSITLPNSVETVSQNAFKGITDRIYLDCLPGYKTMDDTSYTNAGNPKYLKDMEVEPIDDILFTGKAVEPKILVSLTNQKTGKMIAELTEGVNYTVSYSNNDRPGIATANITYLGEYANYDGKGVSVDFNIFGNSVDSLTITPIPDQIYTGKPITPTLDVWDLN